MKTTRYFVEQVLRKRPYILPEWCEQIIQQPLKKEAQPDGRIRYWGYVPELGRYLRVASLEDGETVHNAFPDRKFQAGGKLMRLSYYPETDSLYIELREAASVDSIEIAPGVVVDLGADGGMVGIDIDHAGERLSLERLEIHNLPLRALAAQSG
ncbi:MAG: DUF2283 domain-containing protein [Fimbriimonadales bacterium]|nr:MAG: hypothetical protein KatS3mg018_2106 [Fimbriimonadales bacterium]